MPRDKDFKRLVRTRMRKTGEAYTTARAQITSKPRPTTTTAVPSRSTAATAGAPADYAMLAGMSDAVIEEKTGRTWERWVNALDRRGAEQMAHRDIAAIVHDAYKVKPWWTQAVTVGYERIKGLRARGQRRDGSYEATKSRTYHVPVAKLFGAWANASARKRWLEGPEAKVRTTTAPKSLRLGWADGSIIAVWFVPKGASKSSVAVAHTKLLDRETADRLKQYWSERLDALARVLAE